MKTISDFKKRLKIGVKLQATHHLTFDGYGENKQPKYKDKDLGIREVSVVQSNSFALKTLCVDGKTFADSWCSYPKLKECKFIDNDTIQILEESMNKVMIPVLTYKFV